MAHHKTIEELFREISSDPKGLTDQEALGRTGQYGLNVLESRDRPTPMSVFFRQFLNPLVYILVVAASIKAYVKGPLDALVIVGVLLFMAVIGFVQEMRAESAMASLLKLAAAKAKVRREGTVKIIETRDIVPGDILLLEAGDKVAADARMFEVSSLKVNESSLTGESLPVEKKREPLPLDTPLAERKNMVFMGTSVAYGRGFALVVQTGMKTEIGRIAGAVRNIRKEKTSLQKSIDRLGHWLIWVVLSACALLVALGLWKGMDRTEVFMMAVAAAVAAIPESLPAVVTVVLALGMQRMARHNAIIRKLIAVETLGSTTIICSDKTGTLTLNQMTVGKMYSHGQWVEVGGQGYDTAGEFTQEGKSFSATQDPSLRQVLTTALLCNDAHLIKGEDGPDILGDPTEGALVVLAAKAHLDKKSLEERMPRVDEIPFQSENQYMATLHQESGQRVVRVKGSLEKILPMSRFYIDQGAIHPLTDDIRAQFLASADQMSREAMRVLAMAYMEEAPDQTPFTAAVFNGRLVLAGLCGMIDPPREEAKKSIALCRGGGIKVVMATGDNKVTASAIAKAIGLTDGEVLTGRDLEGMNEADLAGRVEGVSVFARIEPLHKLRIVNAFKSRGHVVAMTGDGVNDAPALESADIGIAMGITGTDVAKEASNMVLADDNFSSIVTAVEEGRAIFNRLRNVLLFSLTTCFGELLVLLLSVAFIGHAALVPLQILWINLVTGALMAIPLGLEPRVGDELNYPPRNNRVGLLFPGMVLRVIFLSSMLGIGSFLVFAWTYRHYEIHEARTMAFCSVVIFEWLVGFNARSDQYTIFRLGFFKNRPLFLAVLLGVVLQLILVYVPIFHDPFDTVPLKPWHWGIALLPGLCIFFVETARKLIAPKLFHYRKWTG
ncbi:MAG: HAD-IC family P-type ATPase [Elusimicrobia bacterium]|nr:HAD-IC family P-type ATPase [Elusimicrobiota bacterium]